MTSSTSSAPLRSAIIIGTVLQLLAATSTAISAQSATAKQPTAKPIAPLAWLVGGTWTADASKMGSGMQHIETRYQWADNSAYIRFTTHFVTTQGTLKNYDGSFFFDPERHTLAMWYMAAGNEITQGPVTIKGDLMLMTFHGTDFENKPADMRVKVTRKNNDDYNWLLEEKAGDSWKPLATLEYLRVSGT